MIEKADKATALMVASENERVVMRGIIANNPDWKECPCGWFFVGPKCPDKTCKKWKEAHGTKRMKLYAHADEETAYAVGRDNVGLEGEALDRFSGWGYELEIEADVDMETGKVKLLSIDGYKIFPVKG